MSIIARCWSLCWPHGLLGIRSCGLIVPVVRRTWFRRCVSGGFKPRIGIKAQRGQKLNARQVELNKGYSRHRCHVEHVFGTIRNDMPEHVMRCIGKMRAKGWIGMQNLCYNIKRLCYWETVAKVSSKGGKCLLSPVFWNLSNECDATEKKLFRIIKFFQWQKQVNTDLVIL